MRHWPLAALLMAAAACESAEPPSAANPCSPDRPDFHPPLAGNWLRSGFYSQERWTFTEDCKLITSARPVIKGNPWGDFKVTGETLYRLESGRLLILGGSGGQVLSTAHPFYVNEHRLILRTFSPEGTREGLVGTWSSTVETTTTDVATGQTTRETSTATFTFTAAMTYTLDGRDLRDGVETASWGESGTYELSPAETHAYRFRRTGSPDSELNFVQLVDNQVLSTRYLPQFGDFGREQ